MTKLKFLCGVMIVASAGCSSTAKLTIKPIPTAIAQGSRPTSFRLAEAVGQFALGNIALALESYRKAAREDPESGDALVGMARCYEAMGRFDLSQRYVEEALALAPADRDLLSMLAASFQRQGRESDALAIRREIALRAATPPGPSASITVNLPPASEPPIAMARSEVTVRLPVVRAAQPADLHPAGPRLERLSLGEVALLTSAPARPGTRLASLAASDSLKAIPSEGSLSRTTVDLGGRPSILVLNAARIQGIAARAARAINQRELGRTQIGDARRIREQSILIAPPVERERAASIARLIRVRPLIITGSRLTLILGRDSTRSKALRG